MRNSYQTVAEQGSGPGIDFTQLCLRQKHGLCSWTNRREGACHCPDPFPSSYQTKERWEAEKDCWPLMDDATGLPHASRGTQLMEMDLESLAGNLEASYIFSS